MGRTDGRIARTSSARRSSTTLPSSKAGSRERDHELTTARFDAGGDLEFRHESAEPLDQPIGNFIGVGARWAPGHDFAAALSSQSLGDTDERSRIGDE